MRTGLVSLFVLFLVFWLFVLFLVFWLFVLFVLDCIIIWWPASGRARVCRVWGEVSSWRGRILARPDLAHRDRRLTAVVLFVLPNTRGSGSAVRQMWRHACGVAVVGSKGKV